MTNTQDPLETLQKIIDDKETASLAPMPAETPGASGVKEKVTDENVASQQDVDKQAEVEAEIARQELVQQRIENIKSQKNVTDQGQLKALREELPQAVQGDSTAQNESNRDQQATQQTSKQDVHPVEQLKKITEI